MEQTPIRIEQDILPTVENVSRERFSLYCQIQYLKEMQKVFPRTTMKAMDNSAAGRELSIAITELENAHFRLSRIYSEGFPVYLPCEEVPTDPIQKPNQATGDSSSTG